jgi:hypothetical protein
MRVLLPVVLLSFAIAPGRLTAQDPPPPPPPASSDTVRPDTPGGLTGRIVDPVGKPIEGADVLIIGTTRRGRTGKDGRFVVPGIPPGAVELLVRKLGFEPADGALFLNPGRQFDLQIALTPLNTLGKVTVTTQVFNEIRGFITDPSGAPLDSVQISLAGERNFVTRKDGEFLFANVMPGKWMLRMSRRGYETRVLGLQMVPQLDRTVSIKLQPLGPDVAFSVSDSVAWVEHEQRRGWMVGSAGAALVTREDLAQWGDSPLDIALRGAAPAAMQFMSSQIGNGTGRGPSGFGAGQAQTGLQVTGAACVLLDGLQPIWGQGLQTFMANQVEAVEIVPPNTDQTRTGCMRFPVNTTCGCGAANAIPGYFVLWSRK